MYVFALSILVPLLTLATFSAQNAVSPDHVPAITIALPQDVTSETVQIRYFMVGPFGGYGGYVQVKPNVSSYEIRAEAEGKRADAIKIVVYVPGCKIQKFDLAFPRGDDLTEPFACYPLPTTHLSGQIPPELAKKPNSELLITYMGYWAHEYFGIVDGAVLTFDVATVKPEPDGSFVVDIPDFSLDMPATPRFEPAATLRLSLHDSNTWNHIAHGLEPELPELRTETHELRIVPTYPQGLRFTGSPGWDL